jgi:flagellar hook assembly protein FlgD
MNNFELFQNYPNPFNGSTQITFSLKKQESVSLVIYDLSGKEVKTLLNSQGRTIGRHEVVWNGINNAGKEVSSGVYIYSLSTKDFTQSKKLLYLK